MRCRSRSDELDAAPCTGPPCCTSVTGFAAQPSAHATSWLRHMHVDGGLHSAIISCRCVPAAGGASRHQRERCAIRCGLIIALGWHCLFFAPWAGVGRACGLLQACHGCSLQSSRAESCAPGVPTGNPPRDIPSALLPYFPCSAADQAGLPHVSGGGKSLLPCAGCEDAAAVGQRWLPRRWAAHGAAQAAHDPLFDCAGACTPKPLNGSTNTAASRPPHPTRSPGGAAAAGHEQGAAAAAAARGSERRLCCFGAPLPRVLGGPLQVGAGWLHMRFELTRLQVLRLVGPPRFLL